MRKLYLMMLLLVFTGLHAQPSLDRIEYFFNTDPGLGSGTSVTFTASNNVNNLSFTPDISSLSAGINRLYVRSRSSNGVWSQTGSQVFFKILPANVNGAANINRIEYFFNTDPGFGAATAVSFTAGNNVSDLNFTPNTTALPAGINFLHVRSRDANGKWSQVASQLFFKLLPSNANGDANISRVEYFFNTDPGFGAGVSVPVTPGADLMNLAFAPVIDSLQEGINRLYVRSLDANGKWSQSATQLFYKIPPISANPLAPITRMEYFINNDPGLGNAVPVVFYKADSLVDLSIPINISGLTVGEHFLYIRSRDSSGKWSITARDTIQITTPVNGAAIVINSLLLNPDGTPLDGFSQRISTIATLCAGNEVRMAFDPSGTYNNDNIFTIQLSNATGNFASPYTLGQVNSTRGAAILARLPRHLPPGSGYKIRVVSSSPAIIGDPNIDDISINDIDLGADTTVYLSCPGDVQSLLPLYNTTGLDIGWNTPTPQAAPAGTYQLIANDVNNCPDTAIAIIKLDVATWIGSVSSDWHQPGNWNTNKVPSIYSHVIIPASTSNPCVISTQDANAGSVQVQSGAMISMINNRRLFIAQKCETLPPN